MLGLFVFFSLLFFNAPFSHWLILLMSTNFVVTEWVNYDYNIQSSAGKYINVNDKDDASRTVMIGSRRASPILLKVHWTAAWKKNGAERYKIKTFRSVGEVILFAGLWYFHPVCAISIKDSAASRTRTLPSMLPSINNDKETSHFQKYLCRNISRRIKCYF